MAENIIEKNLETVFDPQRPFLGLRSFEENNKSQYGGRDTEIKEIFTQIKNTGLTVVFGKSGIGKTSLLKAGVIPELQKNLFFPMYVRIDFSSDKNPLFQLKDLVFQKLNEQDGTIPEFGTRTLWEYFHDIKLHNGLMTPVLILDQFEEVFTIGKDKSREVLELIIELADLAENHVPMEVQKRYEDNATIMSAKYGERKYSVVLSLREDYLAQLESYKRYMPSINSSRYRVVQMTAMQALEAATKSSNGLIEKDVAIEIIKKLPRVTDRDFDETAIDPDNETRLKVEPFLLSLICFQVNEKRIEKGLDKITFDLVSQFNVQDVINSYYNDTVNQFSENVQIAFENTLITESGFRKLQSIEELKNDFNIDDDIIEALVDKRIIRKEQRDNVDYVELIHDVLRDVVRKKRDKRIKDIKDLKEQQSLRRSLELDRYQQRKRQKKILIGAATLFATIISGILIYFYQQNAAETMRLRNLEFAQRLLVISNGVYENYGEKDDAALISNAAFEIYKQNKGEDYNPFYKSLYLTLENYRKNFLFYAPPAASTRAVRTINFVDDTLYIGYADGKIFKKSWKNELDSLHLYYDVKDRITSACVNNDATSLAVTGSFQYIQYFDLTSDTGSTVLIGANSDFLSDNINGKTVQFNNQGDLFLRTDTALAGWEMNRQFPTPIKWNKRVVVKIDGGKITILQDSIKWGLNKLYFGDYLKSMAVATDKIAVGVDSALYIISKDTLAKIVDRDLGIVTAVTFDPEMKYVFAGNGVGGLCKISLDSYKIEYNQNQTGRTQSIVCSKNGKYIAAGSGDGSVAIFDSEKDWYLQTPVFLKKQKCDDTSPRVNVMTFSPDEKYILVGYLDGTVLKWPISTEVLSSFVSDTLNSREKKLNTTLWNKYIKKELTKKYFGTEITPEILEKYK